jgi:hypothetical protein
MSLHNIPEKYNIIIRLWTNCFYCLLESLWRSSLNSRISLEYLQEFIYCAYTLVLPQLDLASSATCAVFGKQIKNCSLYLLELAEDPSVFEVVYIHKYFQMFSYFILFVIPPFSTHDLRF